VTPAVRPDVVVLVALVALPAAVGIALALGARSLDRSRHRGAARAAASTAAAATLGLAVAAAVARPSAGAPFLAADVPGAGLELAVDGLAAAVTVTVAAVTLAVVVAASSPALADASTDPAAGRSRPRLLGLLLVFTAGMQLTVVASSFPALMLGWEVMGAASGLLVASEWRRGDRTAGGATAFLTTRAADLGLYVAAGATLAGASSLALADVGTGPLGAVATAGVLVAAVGKSAQLPLSGWLSRAMRGPSPVSALLHSATMVAAGGYLLLRLEPALAAHPALATTALWLAVATGLVLGAVAALQRDLKQLLAASTCAQVGVVVAAAAAGAVAGGAAHLVAHAAVKAALFLAAGAWLAALGSKQLADLRGAARRHPVLGAAVVLAAAALAGVPPLPLWTTKDLVAAGLEGTVLHAALYGVTALAGLYAGKVAGVVLAAPLTGSTTPADPAPEAPASAAGGGAGRGPVAAVVALVVAAVAASALALPPVLDAWTSLVGARVPEPALVPALVSGGVAVVAAAAAAGTVAARPGLWARVETTAAQAWFGLPAALDRAGAAVLPLAAALARADDTVHDRVVLAVPRRVRALAHRAGIVDDGAHGLGVVAAARATVALAAASGRVDAGRVHGAVEQVGAAARWLGGQARRPQTGLLHQYYFQIAAGTAVLLAVLLLPT
jgi:NADH-quinone oxidoreductase subunit L